MRIRKRLPPSSLSSSLPLSDPQPINLLPAVQQHVKPTEEGHTDLQPSDPDQRLMIGSSWTLWSPGFKPHRGKQEELEGGEVGEDRWREEEECNDIGKGSIFGAGGGCKARPLSGSSQYVVPFKKRRGMFNTEMEMIKKTNARLTKTNKKYVVQNNGTGERKERESIGGDVRERKNKRGSVIMEGSRCSRVNGRGWRCCQQTLVGYSLCEHHLGKGRLRSMSSVRGGSTMPNNNLKLPTTSTTAQYSHTLVREKQENDMGRLVHYSSTTSHCTTEEEEGDGEEKKLVVTKKRVVKLGMVKARSIRSLLGQTNGAVVVADNITKTVAQEDK